MPPPQQKWLLIIFDCQNQIDFASSLYILEMLFWPRPFLFASFCSPSVYSPVPPFPSRLVFFLNWAVVKQVKGRHPEGKGMDMLQWQGLAHRWLRTRPRKEIAKWWRRWRIGWATSNNKSPTKFNNSLRTVHKTLVCPYWISCNINDSVIIQRYTFFLSNKFHLQWFTFNSFLLSIIRPAHFFWFDQIQMIRMISSGRGEEDLFLGLSTCWWHGSAWCGKFGTRRGYREIWHRRVEGSQLSTGHG